MKYKIYAFVELTLNQFTRTQIAVQSFPDSFKGEDPLLSCGHEMRVCACFKCGSEPCAALLSRQCGGERLHIMRKANDRYSDGAEAYNGPLAGRGAGTPRGRGREMKEMLCPPEN